MKIAIDVGHSEKDPGACNESSGVCEFYYNKDLADLLVNELKNQSNIEPIIVFRKSYSDLPNQINELNPDFSLSLHCNAANKVATGTEVLYYYNSKKGEEIASVFQSNIVAVLGLRSRGIKPLTDTDRGGYLVKNVKAPAIIIEPFFIDNDNDLKIGQDKKPDLVRAIVSSICTIMEEII